METRLTRTVVPVVVWLVLLLASAGPDALAQTPGCPSQDATRDYNCPLGPSYVIPGLTDLNDWNDPAHYRHIFTGDVDGDGIDELVVRGKGGLQVYRFDSGTGQWTQVQQTARSSRTTECGRSGRTTTRSGSVQVHGDHTGRGDMDADHHVRADEGHGLLPRSALPRGTGTLLGKRPELLLDDPAHATRASRDAADHAAHRAQRERPRGRPTSQTRPECC
jgi:hypothetical protein